MAPRWDEGGLKNVWNSLFDASEFSACKENDSDLQSVSMLLKKTFYLFKNLKERCEEAEGVRRQPCQRCYQLEKDVQAKEQKLKQTESRMKSIAQILNMGGLSQDENVSPGKQQSMAKALTQMLLYDNMDISEDESDPETRGSKRKKYGPITPVKVNKIPQKKSPDPVVIPTKRSIPKGDVVIVPESLPVEKRQPDPVPPKVVVLESLCSQMTAPTDVEFLSDNDETFLDLPVPVVTPPKQNTSQSLNSTSPIIGKGSASRKLKLRPERRNLNRTFESKTHDDGDFSLVTSSPPLSGSVGLKKSPFTPKLRVSKDIVPLISLSSGSSEVSPAPLFTTPNIHRKNTVDIAFATKNTADIAFTTKNTEDVAFATKNTTPSDFVQSLLTTPEIGGKSDETLLSPSLLDGIDQCARLSSRTHRYQTKVAENLNRKEADSSSSKSNSKPSTVNKSDFGLIKSTGNSEIDNILDIMCDTNLLAKPNSHSKSSTSKNVNEQNISNPIDSTTNAGLKKQADYWKLKPSLTSKEPISMRNAPKLKQTKIGFGVHPERTDVCTLKEFNGGVRQSQSLTDNTLREFNGGIRPSQTSTMLPLDLQGDLNDEAAFEKAILESLKDTNTQYIPDEDDDIIAPSPDLSLSKRFISSQTSKQIRKYDENAGPSRKDKGGVDLKENKGGHDNVMPSTQDLLEEMGIPDQVSLGTAELIRGFDQVPKKVEDVPAHKYQRDAVRKKEERRKLDGWDCADCKKYYASRVNDSTERKKLMDKCSKHRDKFKRNDTPPGYWDVAFPSTPELKARNLDVTQKPVKFRSRKRY